MRHRVRKCSRQGDHWCVDQWRARFLVDASGRNGLRLIGDPGRESDDELLAIALSISYSRNCGTDLRTCIESTSSGWWYTAPLPRSNAVAMFFTDPALYRQEGISIHDQLKAAPLTTRRLDGGHIRDSRVLHVASSCRKSIFGDCWLAVGDSASSFDPISGRGIFKALQRASEATTAITACLNGSVDATLRYANQVRREYYEYVRQRLLYYSSERRWSEHPFWQARCRRGVPLNSGSAR